LALPFVLNSGEKRKTSRERSGPHVVGAARHLPLGFGRALVGNTQSGGGGRPRSAGGGRGGTERSSARPHRAAEHLVFEVGAGDLGGTLAGTKRLARLALMGLLPPADARRLFPRDFRSGRTRGIRGAASRWGTTLLRNVRGPAGTNRPLIGDFDGEKTVLTGPLERCLRPAGLSSPGSGVTFVRIGAHPGFPPSTGRSLAGVGRRDSSHPTRLRSGPVYNGPGAPRTPD